VRRDKFAEDGISLSRTLLSRKLERPVGNVEQLDKRLARA
jgi:hypothetical protein